MKLKFPFPIDVRELWRDCWQCMECGENGQRSGGLELHHICGRVSPSALNSCLLCKGCHARCGHSRDEEQRYFAKTINYLTNQRYTLVDVDMEFVKNNEHLWLENNGYLHDLARLKRV